MSGLDGIPEAVFRIREEFAHNFFYGSPDREPYTSPPVRFRIEKPDGEAGLRVIDSGANDALVCVASLESGARIAELLNLYGMYDED